MFQGTAGSPTSKWEWCYVFPTRLLASACKAGGPEGSWEIRVFSANGRKTKVSKAKISHILPVGTVWESNNADVRLLGNV